MRLVRTSEADGNRVGAGQLAFFRVFTRNLFQNSSWLGRECAAGRAEGLFDSRLMGRGSDFISIVCKSTPITVII